MILVFEQDHRQPENLRLNMTETITYLPGLSPVAGKELCARFDGERLSSDGGVLLFPGIERRLGIADLLASCLHDERDPASTTHSYADMIRARMFAIACGNEDCDDLDVLRFDPAFRLACGRLAETGDDLMSQPTLSRLENAPSWRELARMGLSLIDLFCASFKRVADTQDGTGSGGENHGADLVGPQAFAHACPGGMDALVQQRLLDRDQQVIGEHAEEDVGVHPSLDLVQDGPLGERALHVAEGIFDPREQAVDAPEFVVTKIAAIGFQGCSNRRASRPWRACPPRLGR